MVDNNRSSGYDETRVMLELLKQKIDIGYSIIPRYLTVFTIYVGIVGTLLKFYFEAGPKFKYILLGWAVVLTILGIIATICGDKLRTSLEREVAYYLEKLRLPKEQGSFKALFYISRGSFLFCCFVFFVLVGILIFSLKGIL